MATKDDGIARELERLRAEVERFRGAFDGIRDRVYIFDASLRLVHANREALRGRALRDLAGKTMEEIWPHPYAARFDELLDQVRATRRRVREEQRLNLEEVRERWFRGDFVPVLAQDGSVREIVVHLQDVGAEREIEEANAKALELGVQLREVGESVPGVITTYRLAPDGSAGITFMTKQSLDLYGFTPEELIADLKLLVSRYHPEDAYRIVSGVDASARDMKPWHEHFRYDHPTKGWRHLEGWSQPRRAPDGSTLWHGFIMDVTERELAAQRLHEKEDQLRVAQRMEAVGRLAGGVAHDFNNLLTVIHSSADLALATLRPGDPLRADLEQIDAAAERATALTRQLLAFSRKQVLQPRVIDLNELCASSLNLLQRLLGEDVEILYRPARGATTTLADPGQIEQVVMNLAINARDAMEKGGKLTIATENVVLDDEHCRAHGDAAPGAYVKLAVSDDGAGMDAATMSRIFEPFFTTKEVGKGTGLGLATVYGIVKQTGGSIDVRSEVGAGTTFEIYLPRAEAEGAKRAPSARPERALGKEKILLVEDEAAVRKLVARILAQLGYRVVVAEAPARALDLAAEHDGLDLLLTDVVMPGMSGSALAAKLQATRPGLRVLYMSGYTENAIVHHGVLDQGIAFLPKPFTADTLAAKVREVLDG